MIRLLLFVPVLFDSVVAIVKVLVLTLMNQRYTFILTMGL